MKKKKQNPRDNEKKKKTPFARFFAKFFSIISCEIYQSEEK